MLYFQAAIFRAFSACKRKEIVYIPRMKSIKENIKACGFKLYVLLQLQKALRFTSVPETKQIDLYKHQFPHGKMPRNCIQWQPF